MSDLGSNGSRSLDAKVAAIESEVTGLKQDVAGIRTAIERIAEQNRPKRESLTAWLSVVVALASLLLWGAVREVDRINDDSKERDMAMDTRLQREMRDLDNTIDERIKGMGERIDRVQTRTEAVWTVMLEQLPKSVEDRGRLDERMKALEKRTP